MKINNKNGIILFYLSHFSQLLFKVLLFQKGCPNSFCQLSDTFTAVFSLCW